MAKMKAVVKTQKGPGCVELKEIDIPQPGCDEVLIKAHSAGVCGTDIGIYVDKPGQVYYPPVVLGHEFSGTIADVGGNVTGWTQGQRVVAEPQTLYCGKCFYCRQGEIGMCPHKRSPGWGTNGGMAEYVVMPAGLLHKVPDGLDLKIAALAEPLAVMVHAMAENTQIEPADGVVVLGAGPIGVLGALLALCSGARFVALVGANADIQFRLPTAKKIGIDLTLNADADDVESIIMDLTDGIGADMVVDACGAEQAIQLGLKVLRKKGKFVATGIAKDKISFDWNKAVLKNIAMYFQYSSTFTSWRKTLGILELKSALFSRTISKTFPLEKWEEAFDQVQKGLVIKTLLCP
jgi:L-iditol 2-dehydrogenase